MNEQNLHSEIASLRDHFDERMNTTLRWAIGLLLSAAVAIALYEMEQSGQISTNTEGVTRNTEDLRSINENMRRLGAAFGDSNREIGGLTEQIKGQSRTLERMEKALSDMAQALREERSK